MRAIWFVIGLTHENPPDSSGPRSFLSKLFLFSRPLWPEGWRHRSLKCHEDWLRACWSAVTLLPLLSLFLSQACLPSALTFRRPCLCGTRRPKCHSEIYGCEHWLVERGEGVCNQVGRNREQMNLSIRWFSIFSLLKKKFHLLHFPLISTVISSVLWNSLPIQSIFFVYCFGPTQQILL